MGGRRGRRGRQELNNLLCYWLMLHIRHLELIAVLFSFPTHSFACSVRPYEGTARFQGLPPSPPPACSIHPLSHCPFDFLSLRRPVFMYSTRCELVCVRARVLHVLNLSVTREPSTCGNEKGKLAHPVEAYSYGFLCRDGLQRLWDLVLFKRLKSLQCWQAVISVIYRCIAQLQCSHFLVHFISSLPLTH